MWRLTYSNRNKQVYSYEDITSADMVEYVFQYDYDKWEYIPKTDPNHYQNHSCDPNTWYEGASLMVARRRIEIGEEITYDYALSETRSPFPILECNCACGSDLCRETVTFDDWRLPELQDRYRGHFLPYIERMIEDFDRERAVMSEGSESSASL